MAKVSEAIVGRKFKMLEVRRVYVKECVWGAAERVVRVPYAECRCNCGKKHDVMVARLGKTHSCGCFRADSMTKHGVCKADRKLYHTWYNMVDRCTNSNHDAYRNYGGRGVAVCPEWRDGANAFLAWALASGYARGLTLDRIDNDGPYCPENCRWVPMAEQSGNRRGRVVYDAWGEAKSLSDWLKDSRCVVRSRPLIYNRVRLTGWSPERAMSTPPPT